MKGVFISQRLIPKGEGDEDEVIHPGQRSVIVPLKLTVWRGPSLRRTQAWRLLQGAPRNFLPQVHRLTKLGGSDFRNPQRSQTNTSRIERSVADGSIWCNRISIQQWAHTGCAPSPANSLTERHNSWPACGADKITITMTIGSTTSRVLFISTSST